MHLLTPGKQSCVKYWNIVRISYLLIPIFSYLLGRLWNFGYRPMHLGEAFHGGIQGGQDSCMKDVKCNANLWLFWQKNLSYFQCDYLLEKNSKTLVKLQKDLASQVFVSNFRPIVCFLLVHFNESSSSWSVFYSCKG